MNRFTNVKRLKRYLLFPALLWCSLQASAQNGTNDPTFNSYNNSISLTGSGFNSTTTSSVTQTDGKIIVSGDYQSYDGITRSCLVRLNTDGTLDTSFDTGTGFYGPSSSRTSAIALLPNGKILVVGMFTSFNDLPANRIVCLNSDGTRDATFLMGDGFDGEVRNIKVQNDGKIICVGIFSTYNNISSPRCIRLNADGTKDDSFNVGTGFNGAVYTLAIANNGNIYLGGTFTTYNGSNRSRIIRLTNDGTIDNSFVVGTGINNIVDAMILQDDGKLIVLGSFNNYNGVLCPKIVRINENGSPDNTFQIGSGISGSPYGIGIQSDGKIVIAGYINSYNGTICGNYFRLNTNGTYDATFQNNSVINSTVTNLTINSSDQILMCGYFTSIASTARSRFAIFDSNGTLTNFGAGGGMAGVPKSILSFPSGEISAGGKFTAYNNEAFNNYLFLQNNGSIDPTFQNDGVGFASEVNVVARQSDGKLLIGGDIYHYAGSNPKNLLRMNPDGSIDPTFNIGNGFSGAVQKIIIQPDGKLVISGDFYMFNSQNIRNILRLNPNGSLDPSFQTSVQFNSGVHTMALLPDGKIIVGGNFINANGSPIKRIARLNTDGTIDNTFTIGTGFDNAVKSVSLQTNGKIVVGGTFTSYDGTAVNGICRLNADGTLDQSFTSGTGFNDYVNEVICQRDGKILVAGKFTNYNGSTANFLVKLLNNGSIDPSFEAVYGPNNEVTSMHLQADGKLLIGGKFNKIGTNIRNGIARILNTIDPPVQHIHEETHCDQYTWIDDQVYTASTTTPSILIPGGSITGNDSIVVLHLTINNGTYDAFTESNCISHTWNNSVYTETDTYIYHYTNAAGCASADTLHLTINTGTFLSETVAACNEYLWNNSLYTTSGTHIHHYTDANGCASADTLHLTINTGTFLSETVTACTEYLWNDSLYTASGTHIYHYTNSTGCSSADTLHLTINTGTFLAETVAACDNYLWNDSLYTASGTHIFHYTNANGCASADTLHLTINTGTFLAETVAACDNYLWNDSLYTASGTHIYHYTNATGCASADTLHLTIHAVDISVSETDFTFTANQNGATYQWIDCATGDLIPGETQAAFTATENGSYAVIVTKDGCTDTSACISVSTLGIDAVNWTKLEVYPNPTTGAFVLNSSIVLSNATVEVFSSVGQLIDRIVFTGNTLNLDLSNQPNGVYTVRLNNNQHVKMVKQ